MERASSPPLVSGSLRYSLACVSITPASAPLFTWPPPLCMCSTKFLFSYKDTSHFELKAHPPPVEPHFNLANYFCNDPISNLYNQFQSNPSNYKPQSQSSLSSLPYRSNQSPNPIVMHYLLNLEYTEFTKIPYLFFSRCHCLS